MKVPVFRLRLVLDDENMKTSDDIADALEDAAKNLRNGSCHGISRDSTGKKVGAYGTRWE